MQCEYALRILGLFCQFGGAYSLHARCGFTGLRFHYSAASPPPPPFSVCRICPNIGDLCVPFSLIYELCGLGKKQLSLNFIY